MLFVWVLLVEIVWCLKTFTVWLVDSIKRVVYVFVLQQTDILSNLNGFFIDGYWPPRNILCIALLTQKGNLAVAIHVPKSENILVWYTLEKAEARILNLNIAWNVSLTFNQ